MEYWEADFLRVQVTGATLGIIGMGDIGYKIALRAKAFEMNILCHNRRQSDIGENVFMANALKYSVILLVSFPTGKEEEEQGVSAIYCKKMNSLLQQADFLVVVVSLTPQTPQLIGKRELEPMKPTATLINIGRGTIHNWYHPQLFPEWPDEKGRGSFAGRRDHALLKLKNIIITPHLGIKAEKATPMITEEALEIILAALNGLHIPSAVLWS